MKIMLTAIFVALIGLYFLKKAAKIKMQIKPKKYASNIAGGTIFGVGYSWNLVFPGTPIGLFALLGAGAVHDLFVTQSFYCRNRDRTSHSTRAA